MNLQISGHHLEVTPAIREYIQAKLDRITRHFEQVIDVQVTVSVEKVNQKAEATVHLRGKDIHVEAIEGDLYAAIDLMADKLDRQILKHKEKHSDHRQDGHLKQALNDQATA